MDRRCHMFCRFKILLYWAKYCSSIPFKAFSVKVNNTDLLTDLPTIQYSAGKSWIPDTNHLPKHSCNQANFPWQGQTQMSLVPQQDNLCCNSTNNAQKNLAKCLRHSPGLKMLQIQIWLSYSSLEMTIHELLLVFFWSYIWEGLRGLATPKWIPGSRVCPLNIALISVITWFVRGQWWKKWLYLYIVLVI